MAPLHQWLVSFCLLLSGRWNPWIPGNRKKGLWHSVRSFFKQEKKRLGGIEFDSKKPIAVKS